MISCKEEGEDDTSRVEATGKREVREEREGEKKTGKRESGGDTSVGKRRNTSGDYESNGGGRRQWQQVWV